MMETGANMRVLNEEIINEYKDYIESKIRNNSFDFDTWCQHQYGVSPDDLNVKPVISFDVVSGKFSHK